MVTLKRLHVICVQLSEHQTIHPPLVRPDDLDLWVESRYHRRCQTVAVSACVTTYGLVKCHIIGQFINNTLCCLLFSRVGLLMKITKGVLLTSDAQLKVYLMHLRNQQPNLFGGPRHSERELDAEHIFVHNQTEALVGQLQPLIDDWTVKNSYLDDEEEGDSEVE